MQTLAKHSSWHPMKYMKVFFSPRFFKGDGVLNKKIFQLWTAFQSCSCRPLCAISKRSVRNARAEYQAVCSLLRRSGLDGRSPSEIVRVSSNFRISLNRLSNTPEPERPTTQNSCSDPSDGVSGDEDPKKKPSDRDKIKFFLKLSILISLQLFLIFAVYEFSSTLESSDILNQVSWNDFVYHMLAKGEVQRIIVEPELEMADIIVYPRAIIKGRPVMNRVYHMIITNPDKFEERVRAAEASLGIKPGNGIQISYDRKFALYSRLLFLAVFAGVLYLVFRARGKGYSMDLFSHMKRAKFTLVDPLTGSGKGVRFSDVAGLREAKQEVMELVDYLRRPDHYEALGAKVPKGALLLGPPGCGKTMLAKAIATEANVPFLSMNGSEFMEMVGGLGAARVRNLFQEAKKRHAIHYYRAPSIIYIDEIDSMGGKRGDNLMGGTENREREQTLNQFLVEMDGMASRGNVIVIASTNRAEVLDKALLRPGRFDRHIMVDLPTLEERKEIFEQHLKNIRLEKEPSAHSWKLAHLTPGFSGADIANVCNEAALCAAKNMKTKVDGGDLDYALDRIVGGVEKKNHAMSPSEKKIVAYHEAGHALSAWLLEHTDALLKVTIVPRTNMALGYAQYVPTDQKLYTKEQLIERMCMMLGGRVAESLIFNRVTTGAETDLKKVTKVAYAFVQQFGMSPTVGLLSFDPEYSSGYRKKMYSKKLGNLMDAEASRIIFDSYKRTEKLLLDNKDKLKLIAEELLKRETLSHEDVKKLIGPPPFSKKQFVDQIDLNAVIEIHKSQEPPEPEAPSPQPSPV